MAKTLTIKDPVSGENYTLEYTRKIHGDSEHGFFLGIS